jgi:chemotaxis protein histidine kinase CheA
VVRDAAHKSSKRVAFCTEGEETEIERNLVDSITG